MTQTLLVFIMHSLASLSKNKERIQWIKPKILCVYFIVRLLHLNRISKSNKSMILDNNQNHKNINEENFWEIMEVIFKDKDGIPMKMEQKNMKTLV